MSLLAAPFDEPNKLRLVTTRTQPICQRIALAEAVDTANTPDGMSLPKELKLRENRLAAMAAAKGKMPHTSLPAPEEIGRLCQRRR